MYSVLYVQYMCKFVDAEDFCCFYVWLFFFFGFAFALAEPTRHFK